MRILPAFHASILLALSLALSGCTLGPTAVRFSHKPYNEAIQRTASEQLLLNLVRLQYREPPLFLEIGSVAAQFNFAASARADAMLIEDDAYSRTNNPESLGLGAEVGYEERPTVTYRPLQGDDFVKRLLTPVDLDTIVLLTHSGWNVDRVLRLTVRALNGLDNANRASGPTPVAAPDFESFARAVALLRDMQWEGQLEFGYESRLTDLSAGLPAQTVSAADILAAVQAGYRFRTVSDDRVVLVAPANVLVMRVPPQAVATASMQELAKLLGLATGRTSYDVQAVANVGPNPAVEPGSRSSVDVATRSVMGTLFYLSQAVEVPPAHREAGVVTTTLDDQGAPFDWTRVTGDLFRVHSSALPPCSAAVAVRYRGYWFYIDDADLTSKSTFGLLGQLLALQAGGEVNVAPLLTLPVGGR